MTSGGRGPPNTVLALALGDACVVEAVTTTCTGKLSVALCSAHHAANLLGRHRGWLRLERLPALAASTPHRRNVQLAACSLQPAALPSSQWIPVVAVDQYPAALPEWIMQRPGQYPAATWISHRPPLKEGRAWRPAAATCKALRRVATSSWVAPAAGHSWPAAGSRRGRAAARGPAVG